ncbi:adenosylcobinamide amidohydrolase [Blastochloris viridis]|uniref:Adenosylcobinamide amidohydrolase n=1 Tax=Blastochloris viridis TaxID=1079 RepID=A0A0H5BBZ1_BLAVI|nr:adenosylcobinamide amidohydrolase [Blastochloris viridis]ALK10289.1 Adenosylcobinamide amidohydrolase [Blastochloris viridis]BAR99777.1 adenosylcobinamide amidohydrolase [Blastochloris viridis]CUU42951.1 Adenosylcobinamide amidohydrolase [Blastochloris viridis]
MLLARFTGTAELHRDDKLVSVRFLTPHRVFSTCPANGGFADHLDLVFNHQSCEPVGHIIPALHEAYRQPQRYAAGLLDSHGLAGAAGAGLATAANINTLAIAEEAHRDLKVVALATAGVEGGGARAGDPAGYYEFDGRFERRGDIGPETPGTINVIVLVNSPMTEGAMVRAVMTATEAKAAVMQELSVPSRQSAKIATGTGTDQIAVAAPLAGAQPLTGAGHHCVLGELIGKAVMAAIREAVARQNLLVPARQCACSRLLERFGLDIDRLTAAVAAQLPDEVAAVLRDNRDVIDRDPRTVALAAALIHVHDQVGWGVLPPSCWRESAIDLGAALAAAVAGTPAGTERYRTALAAILAGGGDDGPATVVVRALALGLPDKWTRASGMMAAITPAADPR